MMCISSWGQTEVNLYVDQNDTYDIQSISQRTGQTFWKFKGIEVGAVSAHARCYYDTWPAPPIFDRAFENYYYDTFRMHIPSVPKIIFFDLEINGSGGSQYATGTFKQIP